MSKHKRKLGRKPNVPQQKSAGDTQISAYGSFVPFLTIGGRKVTPTRPIVTGKQIGRAHV